MPPDSRYPFPIKDPEARQTAPFWVLATVFGFSLYVAAELSGFLSVHFGSFVGFWLPAGIYMTGLLLAETRRWGWLALAALPGTFAFDIRHGTPLWASVGFYVANTSQAFAGAVPIRAFIARKLSFRDVKEFIGFVVFGALLSPAIGASVGAYVLGATGPSHDYGVSWWTWWGSESIAILVVSPVLLTTLSSELPRLVPKLVPRRALEAVVLFLLIVVASWSVAGQELSVHDPAKYRLLPLMLWAGIRFGVRGAASANLVLGLVLGYFATQVHPGMSAMEVASSDLLSNFYTFLFVASLVSLAPAVVLRERDSLLARLRASEQNIRLILDGVRDCAIFMLDAQGCIASWSTAAERLTGFAAADVVGRPVTLLIPPESLGTSSVSAMLAVAREEGKAESEGWSVRKDAVRFFSSSLITPLRDASGALRGYANIIRDISVRKAWEMKLVEESRKNEALLQTALDGIHILDLDGNVIQVNESFCRHLGYGRDEILSMNASQWDLQWGPDELKRVIQGNAVSGTTFETRHRRKDGSVADVEISATGVELDGRRLLYASARDITARKALEEQLRQSQKLEAVGKLAGGVAHDFNNILTGMILNLEMIELEHRLPEGVAQPFNELKMMARRAAGITEQLLLFARRHAMRAENLELNAALSNVMKLIARLLGEHIEVSLVPGASALWVKGDSSMLDQVVMNISINARDSMPSGGRLTVETSLAEFDAASVQGEARPGRFACVCIRDTGGGIPPEVLPHIFEPFYTTKDVGKGTGLGLATVDGIIHQHGGWVTVESVVGRGTTFRFYLPISETREVSRESSRTPAMSGGSERILLVEDEEAVRKVGAAILRRLGYEVLVAQDGPGALDLWEAQGRRFDLLLTDMVMPGGLSGLQLASKLRQMKPSLNVVIMSGYNEQIMEGDALRSAGFSFVGKPFEAAVLADVVRRALG